MDRRVAVSLLAAIVGLLGVVDAAYGKEFTFRTCYPGDDIYLAAGGGWSKYYVSSNPPVRAEIDCPTGVSLESVASTILGTENELYFGANNNMPIGATKFRVSVSGDLTGYEVSLAPCDDCLPWKVIAPPSPGVTEWEESVDLWSNPRIVLRLRCIEMSCSSRGKVSFNSFELVARDDRRPEVSAFLMAPVWIRSEMLDYSVFAHDNNESGIKTAAAGIVGQPRAWVSPWCNLHPNLRSPDIFQFPIYCAQFYREEGMLDFRALQDGTYVFEATATDAAGREAYPVQRTLRIDRTPPSTPAGVTITPTEESGWTDHATVSVSWRNREEQYATSSQSGIHSAWWDLEPLDGQASDPEPLSQASSGPTSRLSSVSIPEDGRWELITWTEDLAGNKSGKQSTEIGRDIDTPPTPALGELGWLNGADLLASKSLEIDAPVPEWLESGMCGAAVEYSAQSTTIPTLAHVERDLTRAAELPRLLPEGSSWVHVRSVSCAGLGSPTAHLELKFDSVRPTVSLLGAGSEWLADSSSLRLSATDSGSGVESIRHAVGSGPWTTADGDEVPLVLGSGVHELSFIAIDRAGNDSSETAQRATVKIDSTPPVAGFDPRRDDDPTLLTGSAIDPHSGVRDVKVELQPLSGQVGATIVPRTEVSDDPGLPGGIRFQTRFDDAAIPAGRYQAMVSVTDRVGNTSTTSALLTTGSPLQFTSPLRAARTITAALALIERRCVPKVRGGCRRIQVCPRGSRRCSNELVANLDDARAARTEDFGAKAAVAGRLTDAGGRPLPGIAVSVSSQVAGQPPTPLGTAVTDAEGRYMHNLPAGPNRRLHVVVPATATTLRAAAFADLGIRASGVLRYSLSRKGNVAKVRFRGQIKGLLSTHSPADARVQLRFATASGPQDLVAARVDARGRFSTASALSIPLIAGKPRKLKVQAVVESERTGWPYQDGPTNVVVVKLPAG